jgi:O-antigen/teichoic acid export membrane protein
VIQLAGLIVFNSDNIVISHYLSPAQVTPYAITFRLVGYILTLQTLITPALWPAYAEAYAKGHLSWIRMTYNRVRWISVAGLTVGCSITLFLGRQIIRIWAGPQAVPSQMLITLMCVWIVICAFATNQSLLMGATYRIGKQAIAAIGSVLANLTLSIIWVKTMGTNGVILATIVSLLIFIVGLQAWQVKRILRGDFLPRQDAADRHPTIT